MPPSDRDPADGLRADLVAFDVDGTLVTHPRGKTVWEVFNDRFVGDDTLGEERYRAVLAGTLSYADWVRLDIEGWHRAGATREAMVEAMGELRPIGGVRETIGALRARGARVIAISGTLDLLLGHVLGEELFDEVYANRIGFDDRGEIAGWTPTPFDREGKAVALRTVAYRERIPLERCAFVGDSENDLTVARVAGLAIAFNPRSEELRAACDHVVDGDDLGAILPFLLAPGAAGP